jgi:hypothetical protein
MKVFNVNTEDIETNTVNYKLLKPMTLKIGQE